MLIPRNFVNYVKHDVGFMVIYTGVCHFKILQPKIFKKTVWRFVFSAPITYLEFFIMKKILNSYIQMHKGNISKYISIFKITSNFSFTLE